jgi:hypothetical protein
MPFFPRARRHGTSQILSGDDGGARPILYCVCFCGRIFGLGPRILCRWRYSPFFIAAAVVWGVLICSWLARGMCASFSSRGRQRANMKLRRLRRKSSPVHGGRGGHGGGYWRCCVWISKNFVLAVYEVFSGNPWCMPHHDVLGTPGILPFPALSHRLLYAVAAYSI